MWWNYSGEQGDNQKTWLKIRPENGRGIHLRAKGASKDPELEMA